MPTEEFKKHLKSLPPQNNTNNEIIYFFKIFDSNPNFLNAQEINFLFKNTTRHFSINHLINNFSSISPEIREIIISRTNLEEKESEVETTPLMTALKTKNLPNDFLKFLIENSDTNIKQKQTENNALMIALFYNSNLSEDLFQLLLDKTDLTIINYISCDVLAYSTLSKKIRKKL
jgi:ankyrin repeat protein